MPSDLYPRIRALRSDQPIPSGWLLDAASSHTLTDALAHLRCAYVIMAGYPAVPASRWIAEGLDPEIGRCAEDETSRAVDLISDLAVLARAEAGGEWSLLDRDGRLTETGVGIAREYA